MIVGVAEKSEVDGKKMVGLNLRFEIGYYKYYC